MDILPDDSCEWAVNTLGNVLLALDSDARLSAIDHARLESDILVIHHDWFRRTSVRVPSAILEALATSPTVLLVLFEAGGNVLEMDLPLRHVDMQKAGDN